MRSLNAFCLVLVMCCLSIHSVEAQRPGRDLLPNPKNIIILIGDGMGFNHVQAAKMYAGIPDQEYEKFPVKLAMSHYPAKAGSYGDGESNFFATGYNTVAAWTDTLYLKRNYTESAAAATAMATGVKTYNNSIGMSVGHDTLINLVQWAKSIGKSAGVVTTVPFFHATPAGFTAHNVVRTHYAEITREMIFDSRCDVIMGCGVPDYDDNGRPLKNWKEAKYVGDSSFWVEFMNGSGKQTTFRFKGLDRSTSDIDGDGKADPWWIIRDKEEFEKMAAGTTPKRVFGSPKVRLTLQQGRSKENGETNDSEPFTTPLIPRIPSLDMMVLAALNVLDNNPKGFFVMIEGGATDWASHDNQKGRLIEEMTDFNNAVEAVLQWVRQNSSWEETLVIVTGDHETGLLWGESPYKALQPQGKGQLPVMKFFSGDHTNSLIPFYARGAGSEIYRYFADELDSVRGPYLQNSEIPQAIKLMWYSGSEKFCK